MAARIAAAPTQARAARTDEVARMGAVAVPSRSCSRHRHGLDEYLPQRSISAMPTSATWSAHAVVIASRIDAASASDAMGLLPASTAEQLVRAGGVHPTHAVGGVVRGVEKSGIRAHNCSANAERRAARERLRLRAVTVEVSDRAPVGVAASVRFGKVGDRDPLHATVGAKGRA